MRRRDLLPVLLGGLLPGRIRLAGESPQTLVWDSCDAHLWIAEQWGDQVTAEWKPSDGRNSLAIATDGTSRMGWGMIRTANFLAEDWNSPLQGLRLDVWWDGIGGAGRVKLEVRSASNFDTILDTIGPLPLEANRWNSCLFPFTRNLSRVGFLSVVFEYQPGASPSFRIAGAALTGASGAQPWDTFEPTGARNWYYWNNHVKWWSGNMGMDVRSRLGLNAASPAGSLYLPWDAEKGEDAGKPTAELAAGDEQETSKSLKEDWSGFSRLSAEAKCSTAGTPVSLFLWDASKKAGTGTPVQFVSNPQQWMTLNWDLVWPPGFAGDHLSSVHFVVNDLATVKRGELWLDNIRLSRTREEPAVATAVGIHTRWDDFAAGNSSATTLGSWGVVNPDPEPYVACETAEDSGRKVLQMRWRFPQEPKNPYAGIWFSLAGYPDYPEFSLDLSRYSQITLRVRSTGGKCNLKVELKDNRPPAERYGHTAYRYFAVTEEWRDIVLPADLADGSFWSYNQQPPDATRLKELVLIVEKAFNSITGAILIESLQLVDARNAPFDAAMAEDAQLLDMVSSRTFRYFTEHVCREEESSSCGLALDRSSFSDQVSVAATGFGLTALAIGAERGWISREEAEKRVEVTLRRLLEGKQSQESTGVMGYKGFFYHFLDHNHHRQPGESNQNGCRKFGPDGRGSELSIIDTALLVAGALGAAGYFASNTTIRQLADELYRRVEWDWFLDPASGRFYWGFQPEREESSFAVPAPGGGYFTGGQDGTPATVDYYTDEAILICVLAIGSPTHAVSRDVFYRWRRERGTYGDSSLIQSWTGSLFTYFFAHCFIDFRGLGQDAPRSADVPAVDWWENSVAATRANYQFCQDEKYGQDNWGLTACEGPAARDSNAKCPAEAGPYRAYGALPCGAGCAQSDFTVAPYGAGSSIVFTPKESIAALRYFFTQDMWTYDFGFIDAWNNQRGNGTPWRDRVYFGIDQGPLLLMLENYRSGLVWRSFMANDSIRRALEEIYKP